MSRIAVVTSHPPFATGGHLIVARALVTALRDAGHESDLLLTPQNRFGRQASAYIATRLTDFGMAHDGAAVDQIITLRFPSYALKHPAHVCWLNHTMREYYDQWDRFSASLSWKNRLKEEVRRTLIHQADRRLLTRNVTRLFAQSRTVQARLQRWGSIPSEVLYPPAPQRKYRCEDFGDYIFAVSRLTPLKRMELLVRALAEPQATHVRCVIAGEGEQAAPLKAAIAEARLESRVRMVGEIDQAQLLEHLARCRAVCFPPLGEDYGFVTVEAFSSGKPVITCHDSGGPAELVQDGVNGLVCAPTPAALASALRRVMDDRPLAERMGQEALRLASTMSWPDAVAKLVIV